VADNIFEQQFIAFWKSKDFTDWNEIDIREDFIAPLLNLLGYAKNTVDNIIREQSLNLQEKYHRIGRKQIEIDYIPTLRLKKFWIIEAKPGKDKDMNFGDLLQAHFYAIHPEINARFIVMINGWEIRVYDALVANTWDDYLCLCTQKNCELNFNELVQILGSKSMTAYLRKYILATVKESLMVEVDVQKAEELKSDVFKIYMDTLPVIRKNADDLKMQWWRKAEKNEAEWLKTMTLEHLFIFMDRPTDARGMYGMELARRIKEIEGEERHKLYRKMIQICYGRPHNVFRVQCIVALCGLLEAGVILENNNQPVDIKKDLISLVTYNMNYWLWPIGDPIEHIGHALCHLDNICARLAYKFSRRFGMEPLKEIVNSKLQTFAIEDLLVNAPTIAKEIVGSVRLIHELLWFKFMGQDSREIWNDIWNLQETEKLLDIIPQVDYSDGDADFLWFDQYGLTFDILRVGTYNELHSFKTVLEQVGMEPEINEILSMSREDLKRGLPKPLEKPANWALKEKFPFDDIFNQVLNLNNLSKSD